MCLPRMDSPSFFGAVLGRNAGTFRIAPADVTVPVARRYLPGTMVLETSWGTDTGWIIVRDALLLGPWRHEEHLSRSQRRTPTDYEAEHILLRTIRCVKGEVQTVIECDPCPDYGADQAALGVHRQGLSPGPADRPGVGHDRAAHHRHAAGLRGQPRERPHAAEGGRHPLHRAVMGGEGAAADLRRGVPAPGVDGAPLAALARARQLPGPPVAQLPAAQRADAQGPDLRPDRRDRARAGSTSLPETIGGNRNYDYRFTWIRDATFALWGMYSLGYDWEAVDFFSFIADIAEQDDDLQIMYGIGGERDLTETTLDHLPGYLNSRPVRIGNAASKQRQHDVWGALLDSVYLHAKAHDHIDSRVWPILAKQVNAALDAWRDPDAGIWEVRGQLQHFTSSKIMCWVAADRGSRLAALIGQDAAADKWQQRGRGDQGGHPRQRRRRARRPHPALRHEGPRRVTAARAARPVPAARRPAHRGDRTGDRRRAHRERHGAALPRRGHRRRVQRRGGLVHDLLVLAGVGAVRDRRLQPGPPAVRPAAVPRRPARALRRGDRRALRRAPGQLPAGVHPPGADQRGAARHRDGRPRRRRHRRRRSTLRAVCLAERVTGDRLEFVPAEVEGGIYPWLTASLIPRAIAWVSTVSADGVDNVAPHSFTTVAGVDPPTLCFVSIGHKDTLANARATGEFVLNIGSGTLLAADERLGHRLPRTAERVRRRSLQREPSAAVAPPRVAAAPLAFECRVSGEHVIGRSVMVFGEVVHVAARRDVLAADGLPDPQLVDPLARLGRAQWSRLGEVLSLPGSSTPSGSRATAAARRDRQRRRRPVPAFRRTRAGRVGHAGLGSSSLRSSSASQFRP